MKVLNSKKGYPQKLRRIKYLDAETGREFVFLTNNTDLDALEIALLYKKPLEGELFFKWMKQHMKIKSFWGTTINAVKIQIYCANIRYCLVAIIKNKLGSRNSIYKILQILNILLLDKATVKEMYTECDYKKGQRTKLKKMKINGL